MECFAFKVWVFTAEVGVGFGWCRMGLSVVSDLVNESAKLGVGGDVEVAMGKVDELGFLLDSVELEEFVLMCVEPVVMVNVTSPDVEGDIG